LLSQAADVAYKGISDEKEIRAKDIPFANRFYISENDLSVLTTDVQSDFYKAKDEIKDAAALYKDYEKRQGNGDVIKDFESKMTKLHKKIQFKKSLSDIEKRYNALRHLQGEDQRKEEEDIAKDVERWLKDYKKEVYNESE
jgi:hypothetical protein